MTRHALRHLVMVFVLLATFILAVPAVQAADVLNGVDCRDSATSLSAVCQNKTKTDPISGSNGILIKVVQIVGIVAGIAAVVMIILGGIKYVTSVGDAAKVASARDTIIFAAVGLVIIALAASILSFVLSHISTK